MTKPKPKHPELLLLPNTLTEPFGIEFEKTIVGKSSESLKCNICSVPLEQQLKPHILCWIAVEAALSEIDISKPGQINPRTLCMTGLHFRLVRKWFCNLGTPTCTGKSKDRVGKWDAENEKERDPLQKASFSEHSRCTCLLRSSLLLFIVARKLYAILQRGIHPPCFFFFFYFNDQRMSSSMLLDQHSLDFSGLEYFWDILHWCNGSRPWSLKAKENCTFGYSALFAWPSVAWDNYSSPPHPRTNALSIDWNCSPCVLLLALPPSRLPLTHTGNFLGLEMSLLFCE